MVYKVQNGWMRTGSDKVYSSEKRAAYAERRSKEAKAFYDAVNRIWDKYLYYDAIADIIGRDNLPTGNDRRGGYTGGTIEGRQFWEIWYALGWPDEASVEEAWNADAKSHKEFWVLIGNKYPDPIIMAGVTALVDKYL